jgi:hypothetical protein
MNVWLWRSEFSGGRQAGSPVPVATVWQKVLTAPDDSTLEIHRQGKRIGRCRWAPNVGGEVATGKTGGAATRPEGMVKRTTGYTIDIADGNLALQRPSPLLRFNLHARFAADHSWQELLLQGILRPASYELRASAVNEKVSFKIEDENGKFERSYSFAELRNPQAMLRDLAGDSPLLGNTALLGALGGPVMLPDLKSLSLGLNWEARNDWVKFGGSQARVYRLQARILDRSRIVVMVSRSGEILRVELPDDILLVNEALIF